MFYHIIIEFMILKHVLNGTKRKHYTACLLDSNIAIIIMQLILDKKL